MASENFLTQQIEHSKSSEKIENEVKSSLNEAKIIMDNVEKKLGKQHPMYQKFYQEYKELRNTIKESLDHDRKFSQSERLAISLELGDILDLANSNNIDDSASGWNKFRRNLFGANTEKAKEKANILREKNISEYTMDEAYIALKHLNKEYSDYNEKDTTLFDKTQLSQLEDKNDVEIFQEQLINLIIGEGNNFGNGYIKAYHPNLGFYLKTEQDIINKYQNFISPNTNKTVLNNYLSFLLDKHSGNKEAFISELNNLYGKDKATQLLIQSNKQGEKETSLLGSILSSAVDLVNLTTSNEELIKDFTEYGNQINDPIIKQYIDEELNSLKSGKENDKWSILLHSYIKNVEYGMSDNSSLLKIHNHAQDSMINDYLNSEKGYNTEYIKGYNSKLSNYLIKITDFENILQNTPVNEWNSLALSNYFLSIGSQGKLNINFLTEHFGKNKISELGKLWNQPNNGDTGIQIAKKGLEDYGLGSFIQNIALFDEIFSNPESLDSKLNKLQPEQLKSFGEIIDQDLYNLGTQFRNLLLKKMDGIEKPEEKINELILKLRNKKGFNITKEISIWKKKHKLSDVKLKETSKAWTKICDGESKKELLEKHEQLTIAKQENNFEEIQQLEEEIEIINNEIINNSNFQRQTEVLNESELNTIADRLIEGNEINTILEDIRKNNNELNQVLLELEKEELENNYKISQNSENIQNEINTIKESSINSLFNENENIRLSNGQPEIITQKGKNAPLTANDIKSIKQNPNNLDNIIHFSEVLIETGFEHLWSAKDYLFKSIDNSIGMGFDINGDYLNTNELRIFFNTILKSLGYPEINGLADEQSIISHVKNINDIQFGGETKDYNKDGDSKLENEFFKEFFPKDSALGFKSEKFEQAIT